MACWSDDRASIGLLVAGLVVAATSVWAGEVRAQHASPTPDCETVEQAQADGCDEASGERDQVPAQRPEPTENEASDDRVEQALELGEHFYDREMYYRAVGAYEEAALFGDEPETVLRARLGAAMSYHLGGQFEDAVAEYEGVLGDFELDAELGGTVRLQRLLALADFEQRAPEGQGVSYGLEGELEPLTRHDSRDYRVPAQYQLVRLNLLGGNYEEAHSQFDRFQSMCEGGDYSICDHADDMDRSLSVSPPSRRSPTLGAGLSALIPGAGSVYGEHYVDGIYYFGMTGLGSWVSYELFETGRSFGDQPTAFYVVGALTAMTYLSNVIQGYVGVTRYNAVSDHHYRQEILDQTAVELPLEGRF